MIRLRARGVISGGPRGPTTLPNIWNNKHKCIFYKRTINVCVNCSWRCPGTRALEGSVTEPRELLRGRERKSVSPVEGSSICRLGRLMIFTYWAPQYLIDCGPPPLMISDRVFLPAWFCRILTRCEVVDVSFWYIRAWWRLKDINKPRKVSLDLLCWIIEISPVYTVSQ